MKIFYIVFDFTEVVQMNPENLLLGRRAAAELAGVSDAALANWIARHGLFSTRVRGKGHHIGFALRDIFKIATVKALDEPGIPVGLAVKAVEPHTIYGQLLDRGEFTARWNAASECWESFTVGPTDRVVITVRLWPIFDDLMSRLKSDDPEFTQYLRQMQKRRAECGFA